LENRQEPVTERERTTTTTTTNSGGAGMGIIVGILVVVVAGLAYFMFAGNIDTSGNGESDVNITIDGAGSAAEGAADAVEGAVSE